VVLYRKLKVGESDGDAGGDDDEDNEDDEEDAVQVIRVVSPHTAEEIVQLDVDAAAV
tara:strand:+ start:726 stop:896 length:171 start_codon:yes stop_codon:yes gene_type:complete